MPTVCLPLPVPVVDVLVEAGFAKSKSAARRLIDGGGVRIEGDKVTARDATVDAPCVVWSGKKKAVRVDAG